MNQIAEYTLPFKEGSRLIELGGGDQPMLAQYGVLNVDVRPMPTVNIIADLERPLPFSDEEFDGIFCKFALEHMSWKRVRSFIAENFRILRPGGIGVYITANLREQARKLVDAPESEWNDDLICMIFGGQGYIEDTHRCGFSPGFASRLFLEQGFYTVKILPHPWAITDMIIEAYKSSAAVRTTLVIEGR